MTAEVPITVHCHDCDTVLAEVTGPGTLRLGPVTVHVKQTRGVVLECRCGKKFQWKGRPATDPTDEVHHLISPPSIDNPEGDVQDNV